jgi:hypothetical protein
MNSNRYRIGIAALVFCLALGITTATQAADRLRISYSAVNATQAFLWVAQEKGFFAKHGLEGELLYINSGTMNIAALVGGSVQVAGGGPVSIEARLRGVKLLILGNPLPWLASNLVTNPDIKSIPEARWKIRRHLAFRLVHRPRLSLSVSQEWVECRQRLEDVANGRGFKPSRGAQGWDDSVYFSRRCGYRSGESFGFSRTGHRAADGNSISVDFGGRR